MVPSNILQRTFRFKFGSFSGTCFTIEIDNKQYIITARHIVESIKAKDIIELDRSNNWIPLNVNLVGIGKYDIDIAVLSTNQIISPCHPINIEDLHFIIGQDAYFLGYPYGLKTDSFSTNNGYSIPFIKKCIISSFETDPNKTKRIYLDGHNNPGFSGGPVFYTFPNTENYCVASVVSGFRFENEPVYHEDQQTLLTYQYNTGIILTFGINHAIDLIKLNPIGCSIT